MKKDWREGGSEREISMWTYRLAWYIVVYLWVKQYKKGEEQFNVHNILTLCNLGLSYIAHCNIKPCGHSNTVPINLPTILL